MSAALGPSRGEIKNARQTMGVACTYCFKPGQDFKRCERCKTSYYCSRECQKKHWPKHKTFCKEVEGSALKTLLENVMGNKVLNIFLQCLLILEFDLLHNPKLTREPFMARLDYVVEPVKLEDLYMLLDPKSLKNVPESIMGMFQLTSLISPRSGGANLPLTPMRQNMWDITRKQLDEDGNTDAPLGLIEFSINDSPQSMTVPLPISPNALGIVQDQLPALIPTGDHKIVTKPISVYSYMEYINSRIRFDTANEWMLRKKLRESDKKMIRDTAEQNRQSFSALYFNQKMAREWIYNQNSAQYKYVKLP